LFSVPSLRYIYIFKQLDIRKHFADKIPENARCNFEDGWCGWTNVPGRPLNWTRHSGPTPTDRTGPSYDHTYGNKTGMRLELDDATRRTIHSQNNKLSPIWQECTRL